MEGVVVYLPLLDSSCFAPLGFGQEGDGVCVHSGDRAHQRCQVRGHMALVTCQGTSPGADGAGTLAAPAAASSQTRKQHALTDSEASLFASDPNLHCILETTAVPG